MFLMNENVQCQFDQSARELMASALVSYKSIAQCKAKLKNEWLKKNITLRSKNKRVREKLPALICACVFCLNYSHNLSQVSGKLGTVNRNVNVCP